MIRGFKHRGLKRLYERDNRSGIQPDLVSTVQEILTVLDEAETPQEVNLPGYRLHPLRGDLKGFWSVTVRANWRIVFRFQGTDAFDAEMAIRLAKAFGSTAETWVRMQAAYDLAQARKDEDKIKVRRQHLPEELHVQ